MQFDPGQPNRLDTPFLLLFGWRARAGKNWFPGRSLRGRHFAPRLENALGINGVPTIMIAIRMQPLQQPPQMTAGQCPRSGWLNPKNAIAVSVWSKQHVLQVEP